MAKIPEEFLDLFRKKTFAAFATLMADGTPHVTPVWCDYDGRHVLVNSARHRRKDENVRRHPAVAMAFPDPDNPYRHLAIRGRVVEITEKGADEHIDRLAKRYLGKDRYPFREPGEVRVIYKIEADRIATMS